MFSLTLLNLNYMFILRPTASISWFKQYYTMNFIETEIRQYRLKAFIGPYAVGIKIPV